MIFHIHMTDDTYDTFISHIYCAQYVFARYAFCSFLKWNNDLYNIWWRVLVRWRLNDFVKLLRVSWLVLDLKVMTAERLCKYFQSCKKNCHSKYDKKALISVVNKRKSIARELDSEFFYWSSWERQVQSDKSSIQLWQWLIESDHVHMCDLVFQVKAKCGIKRQKLTPFMWNSEELNVPKMILTMYREI